MSETIVEECTCKQMSTIPTRSIGACVKSGRHRRALPRSERQFDSIHDAQQIQEAVDAHYEFRKPNSSELYWHLYPRFPALSSCDDHEALNDSLSSAQQELAQSGDSRNDSILCFVECQPGEKAVPIPTRSIGACVQSGRPRCALPTSGRQLDSTHAAQQLQEEVDAHYEFRDPNSPEHYWDFFPRIPALSSSGDHEALNDSQSSSSDGPPPLVYDDSDDARLSCTSTRSSSDEIRF